MSLAAQHFTQASDLAGLQFGALAAEPVWAGDAEGYEESAAAVDLPATLARIERHRAESARSAPSRQARYEAYVVACIDALRLRYFSASEIVALMKRVTRRGVKNSLPHASLLPRLLVSLVVMDEERHRLGRPERINSLFRNTDYNADIGGVSRSAHRVCIAWDGTVTSGSVRDLHRVQESMEGVRVPLAAHQIAVVERVCNDFSLRMSNVLAGSVYGESFSRAGLALDLTPPGSVTVRGGRGTYNRFGHRDLAGRRRRWVKQ